MPGQLNRTAPTGLDGIGRTYFDPDAQAYITAVETADAQALEAGVKTAINDFVMGCKADGIWDAIKASCILAGARTLTGALVPLKGTAPTNFNFVPGDYNRATGLVGNGSTKYLNSNRNNNADPQDNQHVSVYATTATTSGGGASYPFYIAAGYSQVGSTQLGRLASNGLLYARSRSSAFAQFGSGSETGLIALARNASSSYTRRSGQANVSVTQASSTPYNGDLLVFWSSSANVGDRSNALLAFYSIGESLDLALLDARVTTLINAYGAI